MEHLDQNNFDAEVRQASNGVIVDFSAIWCGPCKMIAPVLEEFEIKYGDKYKICKIDIDESQELAAKMGVMAVPTLMFFKDGEVKFRSEGFLDILELSELADKYLG